MRRISRRRFLVDGSYTLAVSAATPALVSLFPSVAAPAVKTSAARVASATTIPEHLPLAGYADQSSVGPTEAIRFMVHSESPTIPGGPQAYNYRIRRLLNVWPSLPPPDDEATYGPPVVPETRNPGQFQAHDRVGSHMVVPTGAISDILDNGFTLTTWIYPYAFRDAHGAPIGPYSGIGTVASIGDGDTYPRLVLEVVFNATGALLQCRITTSASSSYTVALGPPIGVGILEWHFVAFAYDAVSGQCLLYMRAQDDIGGRGSPHPVDSNFSLPALQFRGDLTFGASHVSGPSYENHFNGVLSDPLLFNRPLSLQELLTDSERSLRGKVGLVADWRIETDPSVGGTWRLIDHSGNRLHGTLVNCPATAVPGHNFLYKLYPSDPTAPTNDSPDLDYRRDPSKYNAVHFHDDDLSDAGWDESFAWTVPPGTRSGVYAAEVTSDVIKPDGTNLRYYVPFLVRPNSVDTADILYVAPTLTWQGYANQGGPDGWYSAYGNGGFYRAHSDGSSGYYASRMRPTPWMIPSNLHSFIDSSHNDNSIGQDLFFLYWMDTLLQSRHGVNTSYHVVGDEDLDAAGQTLRITKRNGLLGRYKVIVTGAHPEYWTPDMRLVVDDFVRRGGHLMYLGGNGQYWVTSLSADPAQRHIAEVRKRFGNGLPAPGIPAPPGEYFQSSVPKLLGGLWLGGLSRTGRAKLRHPPQQLFGVGFSGGAKGQFWEPFTRTEASYRSDVQFVFEGVSNAQFGKGYGLFEGQAIGSEIDRFDPLLKSSRSAVVLATSRAILPLPPDDDINAFLPEDEALFAGRDPALVRRVDVVLSRRGRGSVFAAGSRTWTGALPYEPSSGESNDVSQITANVLRRFIA